MMVHKATDTIPSVHPSLPGHFPGDPIVPGVLLLARVLEAAAHAFGVAVTGVPLAKFHARLKPAEKFEIALERSSDALVRFRVMRSETLIASGTFRLRSACSTSPGET